MKILIVEKDRDLLYALERLLKSKNHFVLTAFDGAQGTEYVLNDKFDVVVLGQDLPRIPAKDIVKQVMQNNKETAFVSMWKNKTLLYSALTENECFDAILPLPFAPTDLFGYIEDTVQTKKLQNTIWDDVVLDYLNCTLAKGQLRRKVTVYELLTLKAVLTKTPCPSVALPKNYICDDLKNDLNVYVDSLNYKFKILGISKIIKRRNNAYEVCDD